MQSLSLNHRSTALNAARLDAAVPDQPHDPAATIVGASPVPIIVDDSAQINDSTPNTTGVIAGWQLREPAAASGAFTCPAGLA
jgi:hypothetical protein